MSRTQVESLTVARQKIASLISIYMPMAGHTAAVATFNAGLDEFEAAVREDERDIVLKPVAPVVIEVSPAPDSFETSPPLSDAPTVSPSEPVETTDIDTAPPAPIATGSDAAPAATGKKKNKSK